MSLVEALRLMDGDSNHMREGGTDTRIDAHNGVIIREDIACFREMLDVAVRMYHITIIRQVLT
jgi:hypothetical protein